MADESPEKDNCITVGGSSVQLRANLCEQERWEEYLHAYLRYGLGGLCVQQLETGSDCSIEDDEED